MHLTIKQYQDRLFQAILEHSIHAIVFVDAQSRVKIWNRSAERLFGYSSEEAIGQDYFSLVLAGEDTQNELDRFQQWRISHDDSPLHSELQVRLPNGMKVWVDQTIHCFSIGEHQWCYIEVRDADSRMRRESELQKMATTDELSQLLNRRGFQEKLECNLHQRLALAIIDVDRFKEINDFSGHDVGDEAIRFVSMILRECFNEAICVARLGGDEFGVVVPADHPPSLQAEFDQFRKTLEKSSVDRFDFPITASIGVALADREKVPARELLTTADRAMYISKNDGRNRVTIIKT